MLIPELYCTDWTSGAVFGHSGIRSSLFDINSLHRAVLSNFLQGRTLGEGERESNYERNIYYSKRKAWGMIAFTAGSCRIPYITNSNTKLLPCGAADVVSKGFKEDSGIWWVSNRLGDVLSQWLWPYPSGSRWLKNAQIFAGQKREKQVEREIPGRTCLPCLIKTLRKKDPLWKYRKIDGKWEQGSRK